MNRKATRSSLNHERWLVSYADFITLLFAFFVVLYAFASADRKQKLQVSAAINKGFESLSVSPRRTGMNATTLSNSTSRSRIVVGADPVAAGRIVADLDRIRQDLQNRLRSQIMEQTVSIDLGRDGLVISLREAGFFDSGSAVPRPGTQATLHQIAQSLAGTSYDIRVEGHTDTLRIHNAEFDSNWELSSARATRIARLLLDMGTIAPEGLSAAGYAEYHPLARNDTEEGRAENRRVDLVVMPRVVLPDVPTTTGEDKTGWARIGEQ